MERKNIKVEEVLKACPFIIDDVVVFPFTTMRDTVCIWRYFHPIKFGKGIIQPPKGFDDRYTIGVGVVLSAGPGYYTEKEKWIPVNENIIPGAVVEFDSSMLWTFPERVEDIYGIFHKLPTCPSVNVFGVYPKE